jgi:hypothetical protein
MSHTDLIIPDRHSTGKSHVFRLYRDGHIAYNQQIMGRLFYRRFERASKRHGYYEYLAAVCPCPTKYAKMHAVIDF